MRRQPSAGDGIGPGRPPKWGHRLIELSCRESEVAGIPDAVVVAVLLQRVVDVGAVVVARECVAAGARMVAGDAAGVSVLGDAVILDVGVAGVTEAIPVPVLLRWIGDAGAVVADI